MGYYRDETIENFNKDYLADTDTDQEFNLALMNLVGNRWKLSKEDVELIHEILEKNQILQFQRTLYLVKQVLSLQVA